MATAAVQLRDPAEAPARPRPGRGRVGSFEQLTLVVGLVLGSQAFAGILPGPERLLRQALLFGCAGASALFLLRRPRRTAATLARFDRAVVALTALAFLSIVWSAVPVLTAGRLVGLGLVTVLGLHLATLPLRVQALVVARAVAIVLVASLVVALVLPSVGRSFQAGAINGVFVTKNELGRVAALGVGLFAVQAGSARRWLLLVPVAAFLALGADSVLGMGLALVYTGLGLFRVVRRSGPLGGVTGVVATIAGPLLAVLVVGNLQGSATEAVGRDATFTGRVPLWDSVLDAIGQRPLLGHGYGGYWNQWSYPSTPVWLENPWGPPHAHQGLLDMALNLGVVGAVLLLATVVVAVVRARRLPTGAGSGRAYALVILVAILYYNGFETFTMQNGLAWIPFLGLAGSLPRLKDAWGPAE